MHIFKERSVYQLWHFHRNIILYEYNTNMMCERLISLKLILKIPWNASVHFKLSFFPLVSVVPLVIVVPLMTDVPLVHDMLLFTMTVIDVPERNLYIEQL